MLVGGLVWRLAADVHLTNPTTSELKFVIFINDLLILGIPVALAFTFLKTRRGLLALTRGERVKATVKDIVLYKRREDDEPLYVLEWIEEDGHFGRSLPAEIHDFTGVREGSIINVYRNDDHDSWWERDILGLSKYGSRR